MPLGGKPHLKLAADKCGDKDESENPLSPIIGPTNPEGSTLANQDEACALEIGVSWVYKLEKEELAQELKKFRSDPSGTVDEMRKRLILKSGVCIPTTASRTVSIPVSSRNIEYGTESRSLPYRHPCNHRSYPCNYNHPPCIYPCHHRSCIGPDKHRSYTCPRNHRRTDRFGSIN